jgi:hypothetical protein
MKFSLANYRAVHIKYPRVFSMESCLDKAKYANMEEKWKNNKGKNAEEAFEAIKERTPEEYFNSIYGAHRSYVSYAQYAFPAFRFILEDVLMDDWLSIMDPHHKWKRDHSLHQPLTAYIVAELLGQGNPSNAFNVNGKSLLSECASQLINSKDTKYLCDYFNSLYPNGMPPESVRQTWAESVFYHTAVLSALFHDIGYPWQYINTLSCGVGFTETAESYGKGVTPQSIYEMIKNRLLIYPFHGYSVSSVHKPLSNWHQELLSNIESAFLNTHGFPGALAFTILNDRMRLFPKELSFNQATSQFVQDWAAVGIMMHDMCKQFHGKDTIPAKPQYKLHFHSDPLSCIIALADVLEEFARPMAQFTPGKTDEVNVKFISHCISTDLEVNGNELKILYTYTDKSKATTLSSIRNNEIQDYFEADNGYIDLTALGIEKVVCECKA